MRFLGLVVALAGLSLGYFMGYKGMTVDQMRMRLAQLTNLPGLAPPGTVFKTMTRGPASNGTPTTAGGSGQSGLTNPGAGQGVAGGGGGSW